MLNSCQKPRGKGRRGEKGVPVFQGWERSSGLPRGWIFYRVRGLEARAPPDMRGRSEASPVGNGEDPC